MPAKAQAQQPIQRLSQTQEEQLVTWILRQEKLGFASSLAHFRGVVSALLIQAGDSQPLGKRWVDGFKARHPEIRTKIGRRMETARFNGFIPKAMNWYFGIGEDYTWVRPELTHNIDK